jgi:hypothetical protein
MKFGRAPTTYRIPTAQAAYRSPPGDLPRASFRINNAEAFSAHATSIQTV